MKPWGKFFPGVIQSGPQALRVRRKNIAALALCGVALFFAALPARAADTNTPEQTLYGKLLFIEGTGPVVKTAAKEYPLAGRNQYLFATLEDKRLRNDEVRLKGWFRKDGNFQVEELNTIHHGELYRIRYYCETCNIVALEPGPCMCCQHPVELQEIPLNKNDKKILITH